jgi:putative transposase
MFTEAQRSVYYQALGFTPVVIRELEEMRLTSPSRQVSQRGLKNVLVDMASGCNQGRRRLESMSCEFIFALELDTFDSCHEYYTQVSPKNVIREGKISNAHVDFLVFRKDSIGLVECKPQSSLEDLKTRRPDEWQCLDGIWRRPVLEEWARDRGLTYSIWSPPDPHGIYGANLLAIYGAKTADRTFADAACVARLRRVLQERSISLQTALDEIRGLTGFHVLCALAEKKVYGLLKAVSLDRADQFILYANAEQAEECDARLLDALRQDGKQPAPTSELITATPVDYGKAKLRLARVDRMSNGEEPVTRRYARLARQVSEARRLGGNPLAVCLTRYANSGRRIGQLTGDQEAHLAGAITRYRSDSSITTKVQGHDCLVKRCESEGLRSPSRTTFQKRLCQYSLQQRAHAVGGYRAFHAVEEAINPMDRTIRCPVPGLMVHVDSTKFDIRCSPNKKSSLKSDCPTLYVAIDSATGMPLGCAVLFGPSRRLALAVLIRDIFHRQGFLPRYWMADGGAEYVGPWFEGFCDYAGATRLQPPPGAPRKNSLAENALGRINSEVAHRFLGSTAPDKAGRSVTAKQKSYATACHDYATIVGELERYLFEDVPETPLPASRTSPAEEWEQNTSVLGHAGVVHVDNMDNFLIATSVPLDRCLKVDPVRGIRYMQRKYTSTSLLDLCRTENPIEMRIDCVDPHRMYVKFRTKWVLAQTPQSLKRGTMSVVEKLFEAAVDLIRRSGVARTRDAIRQERALRIEKANQEAKATKHLESQLTKPVEDNKPEPERSDQVGRIGWTDLEIPILPFKIEGEEQ